MKAGLLVLAALFIASCAGSTATLQETSAAPAIGVESEAKSIPIPVGTWARGQNRLVLDADSTYLWERERACDLPPCPIDQSSGSFEHDAQALHFATVAGPALVLRYAVESDPRRITVRHLDGRSWTLPFVE
jgi:hypothetical protein